MAKIHKLSSSWEVKGGVLKMKVEARMPDADKDSAPISSFERTIHLAETFGAGYTSLNDAGTGVLEFGAFTALRNSTGSCESISEAEAAVDRRLEAWANGEYGAEREQSATPFTANSMLARAVELASSGAMSAEDAAAKLSDMAEQTCAANGKPAFSALEPTDRAKIRKAIVDSVRESKPLIGAALAKLEAQRMAEAAARKEKAAEAATEAAQGAEGGSIL